MAGIKSKNTIFEKEVFSILRKRDLYFQKHYLKAPGKPDISIPSKKIAVFIHSDFWHGWQYPKWKESLPNKFWKNKIESNRKRDRKNTFKLRRMGWRVLVVWEHSLKRNQKETINKIYLFLKS